MKLLTVSALLCAMMAVTMAAEATDEAEGLMPPAKSHVVKRAIGCPRGWTQYSNRCFLYVSTAMTWATAEKNCLSMGANLASVHSTSQYRDIQRVTAQYGYKETWIGGYDAAQEDTWLWSDGTNFRHSDWCDREPNNDRSQHCIQINRGGSKCWDDMWCSHRRPSVCAKRI